MIPCCSSPAVVGVEVLERLKQVLLLGHLVHVDGGGDELLVVNGATVVHVSLTDRWAGAIRSSRVQSQCQCASAIP